MHGVSAGQSLQGTQHESRRPRTEGAPGGRFLQERSDTTKVAPAGRLMQPQCDGDATIARRTTRLRRGLLRDRPDLTQKCCVGEMLLRLV